AGLNLANMNYSGSLNGLDTKLLTTFQAGLIADIDLSEHVAIQPGLLLVGKGSRQEQASVSFTAKYSPMYLQVPVNVLYKDGLFYAGMGPYVAFGLFGNIKIDLPGLINQNTQIQFGRTDNDDFSAVDLGLNFEAGFTLGQVRLGAGYALGMLNMVPQDRRAGVDGAITNAVISINAAYMFGGEE
ncbi:MAG TPA: outer membrane beta-barrel protein, partial [Saprospiraceae bacterium]|nr:outer membrane beta-barrel protein [Saprospiraceae bacterium]